MNATKTAEQIKKEETVSTRVMFPLEEGIYSVDAVGQVEDGSYLFIVRTEEDDHEFLFTFIPKQCVKFDNNEITSRSLHRFLSEDTRGKLSLEISKKHGCVEARLMGNLE